MNFIQLKCFWEVATLGSFSEAAEALYMSQSSISKHIASLEEELQLDLFNRRGRVVKLSAIGQRILAECGQVLNAMDELQKTVDILQEGTHEDKIKLVGIPTMHRCGILNLIGGFEHEHPNYEIITEEVEESNTSFRLHSGSCDIAFCSDFKLDRSHYNFQAISEERFAVVTSKNHPFAKENGLRFCDLKDETLIFPTQGSMMYRLCFNACLDAGFTPNVIMQSSSPNGAKNFIEQKQHLCLINFYSLAFDEQFSNLAITPILDSPKLHFGLCWKKSSEEKRPLKKFIQFAKEYYS